MIVLPETGITGSCSLAERLRWTVERKSIEIGRVSLQITASFGGACGSVESGRAYSMEQLINLADEQLYRSKNDGRNRASVMQL